MKQYKDMTLKEVVDENVGNEIIAIGKGEFRNQVFQSALNVLEWKKVQDAKKAKEEVKNSSAKPKYTVDKNLCDCHPETCCCDRWAIYQGADKLTAIYSKETATILVEALNK